MEPADLVLADLDGGSFHTSTINRITSLLQGINHRAENFPVKYPAQRKLFYFTNRIRISSI